MRILMRGSNFDYISKRRGHCRFRSGLVAPRHTRRHGPFETRTLAQHNRFSSMNSSTFLSLTPRVSDEMHLNARTYRESLHPSLPSARQPEIIRFRGDPRALLPCFLIRAAFYRLASRESPCARGRSLAYLDGLSKSIGHRRGHGRFLAAAEARGPYEGTSPE